MDTSLAIRRTIYRHFNDDVDTAFTNDQILEIMIKDGTVQRSVTINDLEEDFHDLCKAGVMRNVAQNLTTIYLKLFSPLQMTHCERCGEIPLNTEESRCCVSCNGTVI